VLLLANVCAGFCAVAFGEPSPKPHSHAVTFPVLVSVNWTVSGAVPFVKSAVKPAERSPGPADARGTAAMKRADKSAVNSMTDHLILSPRAVLDLMDICRSFIG
jgi:hypothetical protein